MNILKLYLENGAWKLTEHTRVSKGLMIFTWTPNTGVVMTSTDPSPDHLVCASMEHTVRELPAIPLASAQLDFPLNWLPFYLSVCPPIWTYHLSVHLYIHLDPVLPVASKSSMILQLSSIA